MAPLPSNEHPSTLKFTSKTPPKKQTPSTLPLPKDINLPPSPAPESANTKFLTPSLRVALEFETDLDSEPDLPTMTPPSTEHTPRRQHNTSTVATDVAPNPTRTSSLAAVMPLMQRAHSSPGVDSNGRVVSPIHSSPHRPSSPLSSGRRRSPLRSTYEEMYPGTSWSGLNIEPNIPEHAELEISAPITPENEFGHISSMPTYSSISNTFPRTRRRPASPLHQSASAPSLHTSARGASLHSTGGTSPSFSMLSSAKFANEPYPNYGYSLSTTSSMPSTPTSLRSRSPSISSLETIEDIPDAEAAAMLEEEQGKRSGEDVESGIEFKRKGVDPRAFSLRSNKDRKRWSVSGAERRADFSLEVIEE